MEPHSLCNPEEVTELPPVSETCAADRVHEHPLADGLVYHFLCCGTFITHLSPEYDHVLIEAFSGCKCTSSGCYYISGNLVFSTSRSQKAISLSSTENEWYAAISTAIDPLHIMHMGSIQTIKTNRCRTSLSSRHPVRWTPTWRSQTGGALSAPPVHLFCGWHPQEPEYLPGSSGTHPRRTSSSKRCPHPGTVTRGLFLSRLLVVDFHAMVKQLLCSLAAKVFLRVLFEWLHLCLRFRCNPRRFFSGHKVLFSLPLPQLEQRGLSRCGKQKHLPRQVHLKTCNASLPSTICLQLPWPGLPRYFGSAIAVKRPDTQNHPLDWNCKRKHLKSANGPVYTFDIPLPTTCALWGTYDARPSAGTKLQSLDHSPTPFPKARVWKPRLGTPAPVSEPVLLKQIRRPVLIGLMAKIYWRERVCSRRRSMSSRSLACYRAKGRHSHGTEFATTKPVTLCKHHLGDGWERPKRAWVGIYSDVI